MTVHLLGERDWLMPSNIRAFYTCRHDGVSSEPYSSFNTATHVGDRATSVAANRAKLKETLQGYASETLNYAWLNQVHSVKVYQAKGESAQQDKNVSLPNADAAITCSSSTVCLIQTADCLPILVCDSKGKQVAAIHAGWRGLAAGIVSNTIKHFLADPSQLRVYLGSAISRDAFEVGADVLSAFQEAQQQRPFSEDVRRCFSRISSLKSEEKYWADLFHLVKIELKGCGVNQIYGGESCTFFQPERFFSYRRDGETGRMATGIWIDSVSSS